MADDEWSEVHRLIGRIVMADVWLESTLREAFRHLLRSPLSHAFVLVPNSLVPLIDACRLLANADPAMPGPERAEINKALDAVKAAHELRNRATHDLLLPALDESGKPFSQQRHSRGDMFPKRRAVDLSDFVATLEQLQRARARVHGIVWTVIGFDTPAMRDPTAWQMLTGSFDLMPDGGIKVHEH